MRAPGCTNRFALRLHFLVEAVRATEEQERVGWEMWVQMDKILCAVLREAHERQVEETMETPWKTGCRALLREPPGLILRAIVHLSLEPSFRNALYNPRR